MIKSSFCVGCEKHITDCLVLSKLAKYLGGFAFVCGSGWDRVTRGVSLSLSPREASLLIFFGTTSPKVLSVSKRQTYLTYKLFNIRKNSQKSIGISYYEE